MNMDVEGALDDAGDADSADAHAAGRIVQQNPVYQTFVCVGLIAFGVMHLLIGWIALQIAWGGQGSDQQASGTGALQELAQKPGGKIALMVCAVGLFVLVLWQLIEAAIGHTHVTGKQRLGRRLGSLSKVVTYAVIGSAAARIAFGGGGGGGESQQESLVAQIMQNPAGRVLIGVIGLVVIVVGVFGIVKGVRRTFTEDLDGGVPDWAKTMGTLGYCAKGIAVGIVGFLFVWSAITFNAQAAGNTDSALRAIVQQPFGPYLLTAMAAGMAAFGLFSFVWAFNARHEKAR
ncbi:DUF1206 domain-containing protein [Propioniferax innocua]|nr:DUF1206 domain-containing protein [Propioniferax innocua]